MAVVGESCTYCDGTGKCGDGETDCHHCGGKGMVWDSKNPVRTETRYVSCSRCDGTGRTESGWNPGTMQDCCDCGGSGKVADGEIEIFE